MLRKINSRIGKVIDPVMKEVEGIGNDVKEAGKETIEQSKEVHRKISKLKGAKKFLGYSALGIGAFIIYGVPGVLTAIALGKIYQKRREREKRRDCR